MWRDILESMGINPPLAVAGFSGSVVNALFMRVRTPMAVVATTVSGTLVAIYLGEPIAKITSIPQLPVGFVVGYVGVQILQRFASMVMDKVNGSPVTSAALPPSSPTGGTPRDVQ
jgi:hypothetical protein